MYMKDIAREFVRHTVSAAWMGWRIMKYWNFF